MSKKNQAKRDAFAKKQEEKGKKVMKWIFVVLAILAVIYLVWSFSIIAQRRDRAMMEIERKFLVTDDSYKQEATGSSHITQGYICSERGRTVRVRIRDEHAYITIKGPSLDGGLSRYEFEQEIPLDDARNLLTLCDPGIIEKRRWLVPSGDHTFEVDEFFGDNEGLVMAEVELRTTTDEVKIPHFIGKEVTGDRRYYNSQLRRCPFKTWGQEN